MNASTQPAINPAVDMTDLIPANSSNQWPILKDMWSFFSGNAGNINILSVTNNNDIIPDLKLAEKVGGKLTVCTPTDDGVSLWNDVKVILKDRSKSTLLQNNPAYPDVAKCWVLSNRVTVAKGFPSVYSGSIDVPVVSSPDVSGSDVSASDVSGSDVSGSDVSGSDVNGTTVSTPLVKIDSIATNYYFDIVKIDVPGFERFVLNNLFEYGMRPSLILVRWEKDPDSEQGVRAAAATLVNHGYSLLNSVDGKYLYHYNDKPFYNLVSWMKPSLKNPMIEHAINFGRNATARRLNALLGL
jgi:hypothetical protein